MLASPFKKIELLLLLKSTHLIQIARSYTCCNAGRASINDSDILISISDTFYAFIPALAWTFIPTKAFA